MPYLILKGSEGYISELFVLENFRGIGIGSKLMKTVEDMAKSKNVERLNLLNSQNCDSYHQGFYKNYWFLERKEFVNFIKSFE